MSSPQQTLSHVRSTLRTILLIGIAAVTPQITSAQTFFSTGQGTSPGNQDLNWLVSTRINGGSASAFQQAYMWAGPGWISNTPSGSNGGIGNMVRFNFRQLFDLTGYDASTASLSFQWGCDDVPSGWPVIMPYFTVNGGAAQGMGTCGSYNYGQTVTVSGFTEGVNTLDFFVEGNGQTDGLELRTIEVAAVTATPEPATLALLGTGLLGIIGFSRRARTRGK
jgi:hypothetical protein